MENTFCFIICTNNQLWFQECANYISRLLIPEGYEIQVLAVEDAVSMTSGYNQAMVSSSAKYKIYLHQDTFLINPYFLYDILVLFEDAQIGLIGVVGSQSLPADGVMWHGPRIGAFYVQSPHNPNADHTHSRFYEEVECVDGLIMITQYDIPWKEALFKGWDFYDVSQSFEFRKKGYKVIVPVQENPWVIHDDGKLTLWNYNRNRNIFLSEYADMISMNNM